MELRFLSKACSKKMFLCCHRPINMMWFSPQQVFCVEMSGCEWMYSRCFGQLSVSPFTVYTAFYNSSLYTDRSRNPWAFWLTSSQLCVCVCVFLVPLCLCIFPGISSPCFVYHATYWKRFPLCDIAIFSPCQKAYWRVGATLEKGSLWADLRRCKVQGRISPQVSSDGQMQLLLWVMSDRATWLIDKCWRKSRSFMSNGQSSS